MVFAFVAAATEKSDTGHLDKIHNFKDSFSFDFNAICGM